MGGRTTPPGFMVWQPSGGLPTMSHDTYDQAKAEAKRLARARPGLPFYVMAPVVVCEIEDPLKVEAVNLAQAKFDLDDEIPF